MQKKVPRIVPFGVAMRVQLVYSKLLAGLEHRLVADNSEAAHFLEVAAGVADDPVARDQLAGDVAAVSDRHRVGERVVPLVAVGLLGQVARLRRWSLNSGRDMGDSRRRLAHAAPTIGAGAT